MSMICATEGCGTIIPDHAKFCPNCGAMTVSVKPKPCCYCAELNRAEVKFCMNCGKPPNKLPPGIPLVHVEIWREIFTELKLLKPDTTRQINPNSSGLMKSIFIGDHRSPAKAMQEAGLPVPDTDPKEPWLFFWSVGNELTPLRLKRIVVTPQAGSSEEFGQAGTNLIATRCRLCLLIGRLRADSELKLVIPFSDVLNAQLKKKTLSITTRPGLNISISFEVKIKGSFPLMPKWMTAITVIGANNPTDARNIAEMDLAVRQRRTDASAELEEVMERFADAIMNISGVLSTPS